MNPLDIKHCPGTLTAGNYTYSKSCLNQVFMGRKVHHVLPYVSPMSNKTQDKLFNNNHKRISISGVQEKFSVILDKNKLRLVKKGEQGTHILKPISLRVKNADQMPANEHLTMQIAKQIYGIDVADNALIFFKDGQLAYITKRFDVADDGSKWAQDDFASLLNRTSQSHGGNYKYDGNYLDLFDAMKKLIPAYISEAPKLFKLIVFNYLFSNGDAHLKNFSITETTMGDYRLSPAYDLLNTRMHIDDKDFALTDGLLPKKMAKGTVLQQFYILAHQANINLKIIDKIFINLTSNSDKVEKLIQTSFLNDKAKKNYLQGFQTRLKKICTS
jgi:serine/threonine-protein kinase HipA